ncbi:BBP7 family outer membrane beta-barrel protein [Thermogutta sp.]|uniref:BBP7 family outer membrane beta-barrel protein n=1 Tax=Thermogutta sp. TaxID=1962930 RepID=UPI003C7C213C
MERYHNRTNVGFAGKLLAAGLAWLAFWSGAQCLAQYGLTASPDLLPLLAAPESAPIAPTGTVSGSSATGSTRAPNLLRLPPVESDISPPIHSESSNFGGLSVAGLSQPSNPPMPLVPLPTVEGTNANGQQEPSGKPEPSAGTLIDQMLREEQAACNKDRQTIHARHVLGHRRWLIEECDPRPRGEWYFEGAGLIMGRNDPNQVWFSYQSNNNANEIMSSEQARTSWQGGWLGTVGHSFACDNWRLEGTYWGLAVMKGDATAIHPDFVSSTLNFTDVVYADPTIPGLPVNLFTGAYEQALWRSNEIHNAEINLVRHRIPWEGYRVGIDWLVGVRYFRFDERLTYGSKRHPDPWGSTPELEGYLSDRVENNLVGVQLGFDVRWPISDCLVLSCRPKVGLYNNHIHNRFDAYRGDGELFAPNPDPLVGTPVPGRYPVVSSDDRFSVLTEIEARLTWQINPRWSAFVGYRLVAVSEIALVDEQYPFYVVDIVDAIQHIDSNGDLLLHGGVAGVSFDF